MFGSSKEKKRRNIGSISDQPKSKKRRIGDEARSDSSANASELSGASSKGAPVARALLPQYGAYTRAQEKKKIETTPKEKTVELSSANDLLWSRPSPAAFFNVSPKKNILFSYCIVDEQILILLNKNQRATTKLGAQIQGDHVTAYTILLQAICTLIDNQSTDKAPEMLYNIANLLIENEDSLEKFNSSFAKKKKEVQSSIIPRATRKDLSASFRAISKPSRAIKTAINAEEDIYKKSFYFLTKLNGSTIFNTEQLKKALKEHNQRLFAQFVVELGSELLTYFNRDDFAVLPKLSLPKEEKKKNKKDKTKSLSANNEGDRIKKAVLYLKAADSFLLLQKDLKESTDLEENKTSVQEFISDFENLMLLARGSEREDTLQENFQECLNGFSDLNFELDDLAENIVAIKNARVKPKKIGSLFNNLLDFKASSIRKTDEINDINAKGKILKDGFKKSGKILFKEPDSALYLIIKKHVLLLCILFENIAKTESRTEIVKYFLGHVVNKSNKVNPNNQGWGGHEIFEEEGIELTTEALYEEIKDYENKLNTFNKVIKTKNKMRTGHSR